MFMVYITPFWWLFFNPNDSHNWFHTTFTGTPLFLQEEKKLSCLIHPNMGCTPNPSIFHWNGQGLGLFPIHPSAVFVKSSRLASRHSFSPCIMGPSVEKPNESCSAANFFLLSNGKLWKNKYLELNPT